MPGSQDILILNIMYIYTLNNYSVFFSKKNQIKRKYINRELSLSLPILRTYRLLPEHLFRNSQKSESNLRSPHEIEGKDQHHKVILSSLHTSCATFMHICILTYVCAYAHTS